MTGTSAEDPRDALIREQAARLEAQDERIAALTVLAAELREQLDAALRPCGPAALRPCGPAARVAELGEFLDAAGQR